MGSIRPGSYITLMSVAILYSVAAPATAHDVPNIQSVMVLCPGNLPDAIPGCDDLAQALDMEVEEFQMDAVPGPPPWDAPLEELAGPHTPFMTWLSVEGKAVTLHVFEVRNDIEMTKVLSPDDLTETPTAADMAILIKNLMGTSLYAYLAELEDDELFELAVPEDKEKVIVDKAIAKGNIPNLIKPPRRWMPQFELGWSLLSYPDVNNTGGKTADVYNGLNLQVRFPFLDKFWVGATVILTQSITNSFTAQFNSTYGMAVGVAEFFEDQFALNLAAAWQPVNLKHFGFWLGAGPGITRSAVKLNLGLPTDSDFLMKAQTNVWRMSIGVKSGIQLIIVPRVRFELGLAVDYIFNIDRDIGESRAIEVHDTTGSFEFFVHGNVRMNFWIGMVFG